MELKQIQKINFYIPPTKIRNYERFNVRTLIKNQKDEDEMVDEYYLMKDGPERHKRKILLLSQGIEI